MSDVELTSELLVIRCFNRLFPIGHDLVDLLHSRRPLLLVKIGEVSLLSPRTGRIFALKLCQGLLFQNPDEIASWPME